MDHAIEVSSVTFHYPRQKEMLSNVSFKLKHNEFSGMIGPNGGGKTTLLNMILGFLTPSQGTIKVFGESPHKTRKHIGYVPQFASFPKDFPITLEKAISLHVPKEHRAESFMRHILDELKLFDLRKNLIAELSGGQLQRMLIARALLSQPKLLILDEPTASVDPGHEFDIMEYLKKRSSQMAILIVSHDVGMISSYVESVICLNHQLTCHPIEHLTPEVLRSLYQSPVDFIHHHSHRHTC